MDDWASFANRIVVRDDIRRFSQDFIPAEHGRLLAMADSCRQNAARNAKLKRKNAKIQTTGDGELICWPVGTNVRDLLNGYLPWLYRELQTTNSTLVADKQLRMRLAITEASCAASGDVLVGDAPIIATRLVDSAACRHALERCPSSPLAVVIDDGIYRNAIKGQESLYSRERFVPVEVREKSFADKAWIMVFGADDPGPPPKPDRVRKLAGGAAVALAVLLGSLAFFLHGGGAANGQSGSGASQGSGPSTTPIASATPIASGAALAVSSVHREQADNRSGTPLFSDIVGTQADGGGRIPFGTWVDVSCYAPNGTGDASINALYYITDGAYKGLYAPANTFANGDPVGVSGGTHDIDATVPPCPAQ